MNGFFIESAALRNLYVQLSDAVIAHNTFALFSWNSKLDSD